MVTRFGMLLAGTVLVGAGTWAPITARAAAERGLCEVWTKAPPASGPTGASAQSELGQQMELLGERLSVSQDGRTLHVVLTVVNMSEQVPPSTTSARWMATWGYGSVIQAVAAILDVKGGVRYVDGTLGNANSLSPSTELTVQHTDSGSFVTGANGSVEIDVPITNLAPLRLGSTLSGPNGQTDAWDEVTAGPSGTEFSGTYPGDSGGPDVDYVVGKGCGHSAPHAAHAPHTAVNVAPAAAAPRRSDTRPWRAW